jgi:hypothetical protein
MDLFAYLMRFRRTASTIHAIHYHVHHLPDGHFFPVSMEERSPTVL